MTETWKHHKFVLCEPWHKQRDGDATDWWLQQQSNGPAFSIRLTVSVSVLQDGTGKGITQAYLEMQLQLCSE